MAKKSNRPRKGAKREKSPGLKGVSAVDRALSVLTAFQRGDGELSLADLTKRTGLVKTTIMRMALSLESFGLMRTQLWLWFIGMIVTTFPWHYVGILGMPRRMAFYDYANPAISPQAFSVSMSAIGGFILLVSGILFLTVLIRGQRSPASEAGAYRFAVPLHMPARLPAALNSFGLWLALMVGLTIVNYGYPIAQLMVLKETNVPAVYVGASR